MADLKTLFAQAREKNQNGQAGTVRDAPTPDANGTPVSSNGANESGKVQGTPEAIAPAPSKPANPVIKKFGVGRSDTSRPDSGGDVPGSGTAGSNSEPKPGLSSLRLNTGASDSGSDTGGVGSPSIDSLDALDSSEDAGVEPRQSVTYFADETPAEKPTRELPEGLTKEQLGFVDMIDGIYEIIHDPDMLGGVVRNIMVELQSNPEYTKLMAPEDFRTMVRGMRESMGLARVKKTESKAKRATGSNKKSKALDEDVMAGLDDIMGGLS